MATSSISIYQQQATKLLSRKSVILGIPLAAGSIILFLQWRKRKSLKPKPKQQQQKEKKGESRTAANGKATSSNGTLDEKTTAAITSETAPATASVAAPAPTAGSNAVPAATVGSPRPKHPHDDAQGENEERGDAGESGFAYAKRPRLGRGRSSEKFESYAPLRRTSAEKREELEKQKIKEEDDRAAAAAVAAFSPPPEPAAFVPQTEPAPALAPREEDVLSSTAVVAAAGGVAEAASEVKDDAPVAPEPARNEDVAAVRVNGWRHDDDGASLPDLPLRDSRRPSIIATTEISSVVETAPAGLSPHAPDAFSRRPSVITTISAEPPIDEEDETIEWEEQDEQQQQPQPPRRESATVETTIEIHSHPSPSSSRRPDGSIREEDDAPVFQTTISGPIPATAAPAPEPIDEPAPAGLDAPAETFSSRAPDERGGEAFRTDSPLSSKPVVVAAAAGVPAPQAAVVEEVRDVFERAPLAHLPGMGIPNSA